MTETSLCGACLYNEVVRERVHCSRCEVVRLWSSLQPATLRGFFRRCHTVRTDSSGKARSPQFISLSTFKIKQYESTLFFLLSRVLELLLPPQKDRRTVISPKQTWILKFGRRPVWRHLTGKCVYAPATTTTGLPSPAYRPPPKYFPGHGRSTSRQNFSSLPP